MQKKSVGYKFDWHIIIAWNCFICIGKKFWMFAISNFFFHLSPCTVGPTCATCTTFTWIFYENVNAPGPRSGKSSWYEYPLPFWYFPIDLRPISNKTLIHNEASTKATFTVISDLFSWQCPSWSDGNFLFLFSSLSRTTSIMTEEAIQAQPVRDGCVYWMKYEIRVEKQPRSQFNGANFLSFRERSPKMCLLVVVKCDRENKIRKSKGCLKKQWKNEDVKGNRKN